MISKVPRIGRKQLGVLVVAAALVLAGCGGAGGSANATNQTTSATTAAATTTTSGGANASTTTTSETTSNNTSTTNTTNETKGSMSGAMTVLAGAKSVNLTGGNDQVHFVKGDRVWYGSSDNVTVAAALRTQGIDLTKNTLSADGKTYDASKDGTYVQVRVNGKPVDPTTYTLSDGDAVWVAASTSKTDFNPPGQYIHEDNAHIHGTMTVTVDGHHFNFSKEQFQEQNHYFHFEGGDGSKWHDHSWDVTLGYAMKTLGFNVTAHSVTYNGTTYRNSDSGTTVKVLVNGEPVDPAHYRLMDGDTVKIVVTSNGS